MGRSFDDLVAEADAVSVDGWDFSWLDGRATEERPSWGYQRLLGERMRRASVALDVQTGGGEVLAGASHVAPCTVATESWPPNLARAAARLRPRGVAVVGAADAPPLPFPTATFDLVVSRHPVTTWWHDVARVLQPGGTYFSQQVGPRSGFELVECFLGPQPATLPHRRDPELARASATASGLDVVDLRSERLRMAFFDIGAVVYFLRKVIWMVPGFTVAGYRAELRALHDSIAADGPFVAHSTRFLIEAHRSG